jgi:hypothetical protein
VRAEKTVSDLASAASIPERYNPTVIWAAVHFWTRSLFTHHCHGAHFLQMPFDAAIVTPKTAV